MNGKYRILIIFINILIIWKAFQIFEVFSKNESPEPEEDNNENGLDKENRNNKIKISIYYEALCPDSKFFILHQLLSVYKNLENHLTLDFVPYGKAQTVVNDNKIEFYCQHDTVECYANKIHSCVVNLVDNQMLQLKYISCMINDNVIPDDANERCGQSLNLDHQTVHECANSMKGTELLKHFGERTHSLQPPVKFIPTIELNGSQTVVSQIEILKDLLKAVCQVFSSHKPKECAGIVGY